MVVMRSLTSLTLSRPASGTQSSTTTTTTTTIPTPPATSGTSNADYYLSDDLLSRHERAGGRSRSAGGISRKVSDTSTPNKPINNGVSNLGATPEQAKSKRSISLAPSLSLGGRTRPHASAGQANTASATAAVNGSPVAGANVASLNSTATHRPLLAGLLSASGRATPSSGTSTPALGAGPGTGGNAVMTVLNGQHLEASYVSKVATRLRDLVNRIFPPGTGDVGGLVWKGRGAPRVAVAGDVGELLKSEFAISSSDPYVLRSLLRTATFPALTVLLSRLDAHLLSPTSEPELLYLPRSPKDVDALPLVLRYDLEVVRSAWVIRDALDRIIKGEGWGPKGTFEVPRGLVDGLGGFRGKLDAVVQRLMGPWLACIKTEIMRKVALCRFSPASRPAAHGATSVVASKSGLPIALTRSAAAAGPATSWPLPAGTAEHLKDLAATLEAVRKLFTVKLACGDDSRQWMVSVGSQAVWKGMLAFAARRVDAGHGVSGTTGGLTTLPPSPPSSYKTTRGLLRGGKRSPSPPLHSGGAAGSAVDQTALLAELATFSLLIRNFVAGVAGLSEPSKVAGVCPRGAGCEFCTVGFSEHVGEGEDGDLMREAMNEALEALSASGLVLRAVGSDKGLKELKAALVVPGDKVTAPLTPSAAFAMATKTVPTVCPTLDKAVDELPPLILLHALTSRLSCSLGFKLPHEVWEDTWEDYENELRGFVAAEQWTPEIAWEMVSEKVRVLQESKEGVREGDRERLEVLEVVARVKAGVGANN